MIRILTTSYLDQTQAIGLVPIFEYYGIPVAVVYADVRATYTVIGRTKEFMVSGRQKEFNVIGRTKEFMVSGRQKEFNVIGRTKEFTVI